MSNYNLNVRLVCIIWQLINPCGIHRSVPSYTWSFRPAATNGFLSFRKRNHHPCVVHFRWISKFMNCKHLGSCFASDNVLGSIVLDIFNESSLRMRKIFVWNETIQKIKNTLSLEQWKPLPQWLFAYKTWSSFLAFYMLIILRSRHVLVRLSLREL